MKKIYLFGLCGCAAVINNALADGFFNWGTTPPAPAPVSATSGAQQGIQGAIAGVNQALNPKAIRQAVTEYTTLMGTKTGYKPDGFMDKLLNLCVSQYVAKDGTYNTNITVKQFYSCCVTTAHGSPADCKSFIEKVVDVHNVLARSIFVGGKINDPCTPADLAKVNFATAGKYIMVNGVQRCAATACKKGYYLDRYTDEANFSKSKGYCRAGEDPWVFVAPSGKFVLKSSLTQPQQEETATEGVEFKPEALMEFDFFKQYCVGSGTLRCVRKQDGSIQSSIQCTTKPGIDNNALVNDAAAVCNGTFVPANQAEETATTVTNTDVVETPVQTQEQVVTTQETAGQVQEQVTTVVETPVQTQEETAKLEMQAKVGTSCSPADLGIGATSGTYQMEGDHLKCVITACAGDFYLSDAGTCAEKEKIERLNPFGENIADPAKPADVNVAISEPEKSMKDLKKEEKALQAELAKAEMQAKVGTPCSHADLRHVDVKATAGKYQMDGDNLKCVITECEGGWAPRDGKSCSKDSWVGVACVISGKHVASASYKKVNGDIVCIVDSCLAGPYKKFPEVNPTECVEDKSGRKCKTANAKKAEYAADGVTCVATECEDRLLYTLKDGQCILDTAVQAEYKKYGVKNADAYEKAKAKQDKKDQELAAQKAKNDELRRQIHEAQGQQQ